MTAFPDWSGSAFKALAKRASDRYTTAKDMADDLRVWLRPLSGERYSAEIRPALAGRAGELELPPTPNLGKDVFVSYATADKEAAFTLCRLLEEQGIGVDRSPRRDPRSQLRRGHHPGD